MRAKAAWLKLLLALCVGCFADAPMVGGGTTTGESCPMGSRGCMCYPNGTCDSDLECGAGSMLCVPAGCTPGDYACDCADGSCTPPWVCEQGICGEGMQGTSSPGSDDADGGDADGTTSEATSTDTTTSAGMTGADETTTTGGVSDMCVSELDCGKCLDCTAVGPCASDYGTCTTTSGCADVAACQADCALYGTPTCPGCCDGACCDGASNEAAAAADALTACRQRVCGALCPGSGGYPVCSG